MDAAVEIQRVDDDFRPVGDTVIIAGDRAGGDGIWLATDVEGLLNPKADAQAKAYGGRPGSNLISTRVVERELVFKVTIEGTGLEWARRDALWDSLWRYDGYTAIRVTTELSGTRTLLARLEEIEVDTEFDPHTNEATDVIMSVVADDPFFYQRLTGSDLTPGESQEVRLDLVNPGRYYNLYPELVAEGASSGDHVFSINEQEFTVPAVDLVTLRVNTDPGSRQVQPDPSWRAMNGVRIRPKLPREGLQEIVFTRKGPSASAFHVELDVPYYRAWG